MDFSASTTSVTVLFVAPEDGTGEREYLHKSGCRGHIKRQSRHF